MGTSAPPTRRPDVWSQPKGDSRDSICVGGFESASARTTPDWVSPLSTGRTKRPLMPPPALAHAEMSALKKIASG
jgi:hypothetical protein